MLALILARLHLHSIYLFDRTLFFAAAQRIVHSRKVYKEEVGRELDLESKFVRAENIRMARELKFHQEAAQKTQKQNASMAALVAQQKVVFPSCVYGCEAPWCARLCVHE